MFTYVYYRCLEVIIQFTSLYIYNRFVPEYVLFEAWAPMSV